MDELIKLSQAERDLLLSVLGSRLEQRTILPIVAGLFIGMFLTPDLDQSERKFGYWWLYGKLFRHRGISHWPIIGTTHATCSIWEPPLDPSWHLQRFDIPRHIWEMYLGDWSPCFAGLALADTLHFIADILDTKTKNHFGGKPLDEENELVENLPELMT